jgi:hypothetical protein
MNKLLKPISRIARRTMPVAAIAALAALSLGAFTGYAARMAPRHRKPTFTVTAYPTGDTISAGSTGGYRLLLHRRRFPWAVTFKLQRPLPHGVGARFTRIRTRRSRSTLTLRTWGWTPAGEYHLTVRARHGRIVKRLALTLTIVGNTDGAGTAAAAVPLLRITGNAAAPLEPGVPQGIDLLITNPNSTAVVVTGLTTAVQSVSAPNATASLPCTVSDFSAQQYSGPFPLTVPASSTRSLSQLGVPPGQWPQVSIIDRPTDQDGCQQATVTLAYVGAATLG